MPTMPRDDRTVLIGTAAGTTGIAPDRPPRPTRTEPPRSWRSGWIGMLLPGVYVAIILVLESATSLGVRAVPLLCAAPVVACLGSTQRRCVLLAGCCAALVFVPLSGSVLSPERFATVAATAVIVPVCLAGARLRERLTQELARTRWIADTVQRAVLRPLPARIGGARLAVRYASATEGARVGGDLYDVLVTPYGIRVIVGDVRGNGLPAVEAVASVLGSFREAAHAEPDLAAVVRRLDESLARRPRPDDPEDIEEFVTLVVLSLDGSGELEFVNRGHPVPLLVCGDAGTAVAPLTTDETAPPIGCGLDPITSTVSRTSFGPADALVLYTDGISEARDRLGATLPLAEVVAAAWCPDPDVVADHVHRTLLRHTGQALKDDATLLVLVHE